MKKIIITLAFFGSTAAFAQKFEIGAKAGVNISDFSGTGSWQNAKTSSLVGFHAGGFISFFVGNNFAIQPEVLFSSQGAKFESASHTENLKVAYINIPVMLKYRATGGFYVEAGPQLGFRASETSSSIDSLAKSTDLSIAAGLSSIGDFKSSNGINPDFKNSNIQVSIFYTLFNKRK